MRNRSKQESQRKGRQGGGGGGGVKHNCPLASCEIVKAFEHPC